MSRTIIVSNRLPITISSGEAGTYQIRPSSGGLASGLRGIHNANGGTWIGWAGDVVEESLFPSLKVDLLQLGCVPVPLSPGEVESYYDGLCNGVLWPLFHYQTERMPISGAGWDDYVRVNERFAAAVADAYEPGDQIWVHDFHLFLVPGLLRKLLPEARIGYFLHIPFPSSEVFGLLPWRTEILEGLLGADLVGFHTASYLRHFSASLRRTLGLDVQVDSVALDGHVTRLGIFPLGVDATSIQVAARSAEVSEAAMAHRDSRGADKWLLSVDRLDYTKGIPRRLLAVDELLERYPEWRERIRFIQMTAPSREHTESYIRFRSEIDALVGRINSRWSTPSWSPVHQIYRSLPLEELVGLYLAADVMVVTPIRDGMNLVAKEFIAARAAGGDGVLVLSEMAGAASELPDAVLVNPYNISATADALDRALRMPESEQRARMKPMAANVLSHTAEAWADRFLHELVRCREATDLASSPARLAPPLPSPSTCVTLLLDYDGTLVPFAPTPDQALPDEELLDILARLAAAGGITHIVSGRPRSFLDKQFGELPVGLHAEHGLWSRAPGSTTWLRAPVTGQEWREPVRRYLEQFTRSTPGSILEEKELSFSWHFRQVVQEHIDGSDFGEWQARELRLLLNEVLGNARAQVLLGNRVVEVRPNGINKGLAVQGLAEPEGGCIIAIGDDTTDEDLFAALPDSAITVKVGPGPSRARFHLSTVADVRDFLRDVAAQLPHSRASRRANPTAAESEGLRK